MLLGMLRLLRECYENVTAKNRIAERNTASCNICNILLLIK
nr:MAG TPA: hypothetical protein [Caudoviricetes sp.]